MESKFLLIKNKLAEKKPKELKNSNFKKSAIIILLEPTEKDFLILMTARSPKLHHHKGEMSFPGGQFDPNKDNSLEDTALREMNEEIGIPIEDVEILGRLDDFPTITGYLIRPFIGLLKIKNPKLKKNPDEVEEIVKIPYTYLTREKLFQEIPLKGATNFSVLSFQYIDPLKKKNYTIWGASAHILSEFLKTVYGIKVASDSYRRPTIDEIYKILQGRKKLKFKNKEIK